MNAKINSTQIGLIFYNRLFTWQTLVVGFALVNIGLFGVQHAVWAKAPPVSITVKGKQAADTGPLIQGFLHGFEAVNYAENKLDMSMLKGLKPKFWRVGISNNVGNGYALAKKLDPSIKLTLVMSDQIAVLRGGYQFLKPWEDWEQYQADVKEVVSVYKKNNMNIDYWDVWSEPDTSGMWKGTCEQAMEMFKKTYEAIRSVDQGAKIVAPSVSDLNVAGACQDSFFDTFLKYVAENNLKFDAISWHEFDEPQEIPNQVEHIVRHFFSLNPTLGMPEMHINEYSGPLDAPIPGWAVGWLYYLEAGTVNWASRACWEKGCQSGLDWLFQEDNTTPTPLYWVHRAYADLPSVRLKVTTDTANTVALAGKDDNKQEVSILLGRFLGKQQSEAPSDVKIDVVDFPYSGKMVTSTIKRIPKNNQSVGALIAPKDVAGSSLPVKNGVVTISLPGMLDGDAYIIKLTNASQKPVAQQVPRTAKKIRR